MTCNLPFKVGQKAEAKSFEEGYRGAWFRCKIKKISQKGGHIMLDLEYFDYPGEKVHLTQLYEKSPDDRLSEKRHLMLRPSFPPTYHESKMPDVCNISEVIAIVDGTWKVGDLVDWKEEEAYWSGRITDILDEDNVQVKLPEPPMGEGKSYTASCKNLRPSLDWSPQQGWTVPIYKESGSYRRCASLKQPTSRDVGRNCDVSKSERSSEFSLASVSSHGSAGWLPPLEFSSHSPARGIRKQLSVDKKKLKNTETSAVLSSSHSQESEIPKQPFGDNNKENKSLKKTNKEYTETPNLSSHFPELKLLKQPLLAKNKENPEPPELSLHSSKTVILKKRSGDMVHKEKTKTLHTNINMDIENGGEEKTSFSDSVSSGRHDKDVATRKTVACRNRYNSTSVSLKKKKKTRSNETEMNNNSTYSDTIKSSILDLEDLVNKVKWLKESMENGSFSNARKPSWKFLETRV